MTGQKTKGDIDIPLNLAAAVVEAEPRSSCAVLTARARRLGARGASSPRALSPGGKAAARER